MKEEKKETQRYDKNVYILIIAKDEYDESLGYSVLPTEEALIFPSLNELETELKTGDYDLENVRVYCSREVPVRVEIKFF
jgi:hypothetical protein